jgi:hypothetical protein
MDMTDRPLVIGFSSQGPFKPGESFVLEKELHDDIKKKGKFFGERLLIESSIAKFFTIDSLLSDNKEQFQNPGSIPADIFSEEATGIKIWTDPTANRVTLRVTRNTVKPHSWLVRLVRRWLGFPHDSPKPEFVAALFGKIMSHG